MINDRVLQLCSSLEETQAALISNDASRQYLTGFISSAGTVLITASRAVLFIDFRYYEKAAATVTSCEVVLAKEPNKQINDLLTQQGIKTLLIESDRLSVSKFLAYQKAFPDVTVSDSNLLDKLLKQMRSVKSTEEVKLICAAQELTDRTFAHILNYIKPGRTEREVALEMEFFMRKLGSEGVSFDFIVVSGKNSSLPHGVPCEKPIEVGDFVTMDFGAVVGGYHSDMTRTVAVGKLCEEQRKVYDTVLQAQLAAIDFIHADVPGFGVDKVARDIITAAGYGECFGHALGHSLGLEIHEPPACNTRSTEILKTGTIMTVEPGIYIAGKFGVRIEDMVLVTDTGSENLTHSTKELIIL